MKHYKYIENLHKIAKNSEHFVSRRMASCIVSKNRTISYGLNIRKTSPWATKYQDIPEKLFLHAEILAIKNALYEIGAEKLKKCTIYVCRVKGKNREYGMAKPCSGCMRAIIAFGLKRVVYTVDSPKIKFEELI